MPEAAAAAAAAALKPGGLVDPASPKADDPSVPVTPPAPADRPARENKPAAVLSASTASTTTSTSTSGDAAAPASTKAAAVSVSTSTNEGGSGRKQGGVAPRPPPALPTDLILAVKAAVADEPLLRVGTAMTAAAEPIKAFAFNGVSKELQQGELAQARRRAFFKDPRLFVLAAEAWGAQHELPLPADAPGPGRGRSYDAYAAVVAATGVHLTAEEVDVLATVGVLPRERGEPDRDLLVSVSHELPEFLRVLPACSSAAAVATDSRCEVAHFTAWSVIHHARQSQLRAVAAAQEAQRGDVQLAEWTVLAKQLGAAVAQKVAAASDYMEGGPATRQEVLEALAFTKEVGGLVRTADKSEPADVLAAFLEEGRLL